MSRILSAFNFAKVVPLSIGKALHLIVYSVKACDLSFALDALGLEKILKQSGDLISMCEIADGPLAKGSGNSLNCHKCCYPYSSVVVFITSQAC